MRKMWCTSDWTCAGTETHPMQTKPNKTGKGRRRTRLEVPHLGPGLTVSLVPSRILGIQPIALQRLCGFLRFFMLRLWLRFVLPLPTNANGCDRGGFYGRGGGIPLAFPLRLSLEPLLPLRLAEAKDNVPCRKTPELVDRVVRVDFYGVMIVVVVVEFEVMVGFPDPDRSHSRHRV